MGCDFSDPALTKNAILQASQAILSNGACLGYLPTIITSPLTTYDNNLSLLASVMHDYGAQAGIIGIHLEGPFISNQPGAVGCHPPQYTLPPSIDLLKHWQTLAQGNIVLITIASELEGSAELCTWATSNGIAVSLGHQLANGEQIHRLVECGASLCTHLGNGMPNMIHRHHNSIWASLANEQLTAMLITDGEHLPKDSIVTMVRAKGTDNIIVTSDAAPVAGLPAGDYKWGTTPVRVSHGGGVRHGTLPCLAGSGALMLQCMNHLASLRSYNDDWLLSAAHLIQIGCYNPLHALPGVSTKVREWIQSEQQRDDAQLVFHATTRTFELERSRRV